MWGRRCRRLRAPLLAALVAGFVVFVLLLVAGPAHAAPRLTLIRVYGTSGGSVFDVCQGEFDPPVTDPLNPAYCKGKVLHWTEPQWKSYNSGGKAQEAGHTKQGAPRGGAATESKPTVATGATPSPESQAPPAIPYGGSLDPTTVLGVENPLCGEPGKLSAEQVRNCRASHSPGAAYPVGNFGWDIHV